VAAEPETGLVTDCEMTIAAGTDSTDAENGGLGGVAVANQPQAAARSQTRND
jgi:hypothetical protein